MMFSTDACNEVKLYDISSTRQNPSTYSDIQLQLYCSTGYYIIVTRSDVLYPMIACRLSLIDDDTLDT
jgi:hypothetical protein